MAVMVVSEKEAAEQIFLRLQKAVATGRGIANALQKVMDVMYDDGDDEDNEGSMCSYLHKFCMSNSPFFVDLLTSSVNDTLRCPLTLKILWAVYMRAEVVLRKELVGFRDALSKVVVAQSTFTDLIVLDERYEKDFKALMPSQLGGSDAWRHVYEYTDNEAVERSNAAVILSLAMLTHATQLMPAPKRISHDVAKALVHFLPVRHGDDLPIMCAGSELLEIASKGDDLDIKRILLDGGACVWGIKVLAEYDGHTAPIQVVSSILHTLYQLSEAVGLIFPGDPVESVSDAARAYVQAKVVDAGLAEALAHAIDVLAPTLLEEDGLDNEFRSAFLAFSLLFTVVGIICPPFLARFQAAPVTTRGAAFDVLAFVITVIMTDAGDNDFWQLIVFKMLAVIEENPATSTALNLADGVLPGLYVDGEWVQIWNYGGADEGEGEAEGALAGEGEGAD